MTKDYRRLHILVEGQSEEIVVRNVLEPYLRGRGWAVNWSIVVTKRSASGSNHRGGVSNWAKIEREVRLLLQDTDLDVLTTLFDFYAFPDDAPGMLSMTAADPYQRVEHLEKAIVERIGDRRFVPHLILHELETWVFAAAEQLGCLLPDPGLADRLKTDVLDAGGPELVNDHPSTAPSKRLATYCEAYSKMNDGPLAIADLGVEPLRAQCPHLDKWLTTLDAIER